MLTWEKLKEYWRKGLNTDASPQILARSFALGVFIAFSPFPGLHTVIMVITRALVNVNFPVLFVATSLNNPWTMIPFFTLDYFVGYWIVHSLLGWNPVWVFSLSYIIKDGTICLASFLIGGMLLGIVGGLASYPFALRAFIKYKQLRKQKSSHQQQDSL